jgi:hypothetical protein
LADLGLFGRLFAPAITAAATRGGRTSIQSPQWKQGGVALVGAAFRTSSGGGRHGLPLPHPAERMAAAAAAAKGGGVGLLPKLHPPRFELRGRTGGRHTRSGYWIGEASSGGGGGGKGRRRWWGRKEGWPEGTGEKKKRDVGRGPLASRFWAQMWFRPFGPGSGFPQRKSPFTSSIITKICLSRPSYAKPGTWHPLPI